MTGWFSLVTETVIIKFIAKYPTGRLLQALQAQNASLKSCARGRIVYFYIEFIVIHGKYFVDYETISL